jgi:anti-sigma regulatory factor (Ser/Thr protein kinase)
VRLDDEPARPPDVAYELPAQATSAAIARRYVAGHCADLSDQLVADALLLASELVTNAVRHGLPTITIQVLRGPSSIRIAVHDLGAALPPPGTGAADSGSPLRSSGRGLLLVDSLADSWGVARDAPPLPGKSVWFELRG